MTKEELEQVKTTFPWHYTTTKGKFGIVMSVCDNTGKVVDAKTMVEFLVMITQMIHNKDQKQ